MGGNPDQGKTGIRDAHASLSDPYETSSALLAPGPDFSSGSDLSGRKQREAGFSRANRQPIENYMPLGAGKANLPNAV
jgi:hypothetical protein